MNKIARMLRKHAKGKKTTDSSNLIKRIAKKLKESGYKTPIRIKKISQKSVNLTYGDYKNILTYNHAYNILPSDSPEQLIDILNKRLKNSENIEQKMLYYAAAETIVQANNWPPINVPENIINANIKNEEESIPEYVLPDENNIT